MTTTINDGGPAFPCDDIIIRNNVTGHMQGKSISSCGITLRDYFAAKALECVVGLISNNDQAAAEAYRIADSMIKARSV